MSYRHADDLLNFDTSTVPAAYERAAPLIGAIMLAWIDLERDLNRMILDDRLSDDRSNGIPTRVLDKYLSRRVDEWVRRFMPAPTSGLDPTILFQQLDDLQTVRDDLAHNVWTYGIHDEFGLVINRVRANHGIVEDLGKRQAKIRSGDTRNIPDEPRHFVWYSYVEEGLRRALGDMLALRPTLWQICAQHMIDNRRS